MSDDLTLLTDDELDRVGYQLQREKDRIRAQQQAVNAERDRRTHERTARQLLDGLTPGQKDALIQGARAEASARPEA